MHESPLLCIEVLSPDDTFRRMLYRVDDSLATGVKNVWVLDPKDVNRILVVEHGHNHWVQDRILKVQNTGSDRSGCDVEKLAD